MSGRFWDNKKTVISLTIILILGSILRFYGLDIQSFWYDELFTWKMSNQDSMREVINTVRHHDGLPPLHQLITYFILRYVGDSESILRFPSAIFGVLSILAIFLIGVRLYSYREGLIASAFMAVLWTPISFSQELRAYSMLLLFTMLSTYYWLSILWAFNNNTSPSRYSILCYIISSTVSSYLHYFGLYLILLQGLFISIVFIRKQRVWSYIFLIYFLIFLIYLPWLPGMMDQISGSAYRWIPKPELFRFIKNHLLFLFNKSKILALIVLPMYLFIFVHIFYNILRAKKYNNMRELLLSSDMLLILWLVTPFIGMFIKSKLSTPILTNRNLLISLPAAYLLLSRAVTQLPIKQKTQTVIASAIITIFIFHTIFIKNYYTTPMKTQYREAVEFVLRHDHKYKGSIITANTDMIDYYFKLMGSRRRVELSGDYSTIIKAIKRLRPKYIWYICGHWYCPDEEYLEMLNRDYTLIDHKDFFTAGVWLYRIRS